MKQRIKWLRERADEVRTTAQRMQFAETRGVLFRIAESYENMATHLETAAERLGFALAEPIGDAAAWVYFFQSRSAEGSVSRVSARLVLHLGKEAELGPYRQRGDDPAG
jgi:hypothetical protein